MLYLISNSLEWFYIEFTCLLLLDSCSGTTSFLSEGYSRFSDTLLSSIEYSIIMKKEIQKKEIDRKNNGREYYSSW